MPGWLLILLMAAGVVWLAAAGLHLRRLRSLHDLPPMDADAGRSDTASIAVVIAARDEAAHIDAAVRSVLAQRGVGVRVIVADDRSTDATPAIVARLAADDPRVEHARIDALPAGWLGKCHAQHVGASRAEDAEWIVFADADTVLLAPDALARAIALARAERADHVSLLPRMPARTRWARALTCAFHLAALDRLDGLNRDRAGAYFGVGAFSMVRVEAYRARGGHEPLRLEVLDDINLGALMRRDGGVSRAVLARDAVATTWGGSTPELVAVLEKNTFAALGYRTWLVALVTAAFAWLFGAAAAGPVVALATGSPLALTPTVGLVLHALPGALVARRLGFPAGDGALAPIAMPILLIAGLRSTAVTLARGGVRWRETFYPLADLRAGRFRQSRAPDRR